MTKVERIQVETEIADILARARSSRWFGVTNDDETEYLIDFYQFTYPEEFRKVMQQTSN
jgi:hypothetical protein